MGPIPSPPLPHFQKSTWPTTTSKTTIRTLIERKRDLPEDSVERRFVDRQLAGLRYIREEAGGIIEDLDPFGWHETCRSAR
jgi:hypothetical protein